MIVRKQDRAGMVRTGGFTLVEVMVAIIVLAIGLLGLAGLQLSSLKAADSAYFRSQATMLADDILDRMRSNRVVALAGGYNTALGDNPSGGSVAEADLAEWKSMLSGTLTTGDGSVNVNANGVATVVIQWNDSRAERDATAQESAKTQQFSVVSQI